MVKEFFARRYYFKGMLELNLETEEMRIIAFDDSHFTDRYISWLNDPEVVRYSEQRHITHTPESCRDYIESLSGSGDQLLAIESKQEFGHIGNMSISYDIPNGMADLSILIGEKKAWGRGFGLKAWRLVMDSLLDNKLMRKITAGTMANNKSMIKLMERSGMQIEAVRPRHFLHEGNEVDFVLSSKYTSDVASINSYFE